MKRCLIIFAKDPRQAKVKTRLSRELAPSRRRRLYQAFLQDTFCLANKVNCEQKILAYQADKKSPEFLQKLKADLRLYRQQGQDLGQRMHNACKYAQQQQASKIVIIGSDAPNLPSAFVQQAFSRLENKDVVIGPSADGGYYLIGLKKPCSGLFKGIKWSTSSVFPDTLQRIRKLNKSFAVLNQWYDVDQVKDLRRLEKELGQEKDSTIARWTRGLLKI